MSGPLNLKPLGHVAPLRTIGTSNAKQHATRSGCFPPSKSYIRPSPFAPNVQIMNFGLADINNYVLPGGIPVGSIFGIFSPNPWLDLPPSHELKPINEVDTSAFHISNLIAIAFAARGVLIENSALLVITGLHSPKGAQASSISTCFSLWPSLCSQKVIEETIIEEKSIPMKIAWRYNTFRSGNQTPTHTHLSSGDLNKEAGPSLDWTSSINCDKHLLQKVKDTMHVISLAKSETLNEVRLLIDNFFTLLSEHPFKTARIIIEDPFSIYSKFSTPEQFAPTLSHIKGYKGIPMSTTFISPKQYETNEYLTRALDGYVELTSCPKELLPKKSIPSSANALMRWKKPLKLPNSTYWSPPISIGGVWQVSLSRRKAIALVPVSLPVADEDDGNSEHSLSCSSSTTNW
ncbi:hypothetical protein DI09_105p30 [Mitosporidium daphniae]|uniref:Uncharacterized protein n=1 Tax=Mitosporidium daphniae TaxID=1485682 RepID=A0A098VW96_9MICR|nr:uncharacterized protein DI09_105p30 [Mitosporidium daphniae]KGG53190.1 hypothetical protein DI09_105p30 [Mitosporidium daphniae]|eukprot:XP_013239626.1 uncharacterized protein DI09_105p30 [Mitosporidium daphniae]